MTNGELYQFGPFTLDVAERRLSREHECVHLAPKAHDVLVALVRQAGKLVTKRELLEQVWPDAFVEEGILTVHISTLRKALGEVSRRPVCIETVSRSGYRFIAPVTARGVSRDGQSGRWSIAVLPARGRTTQASERERSVGLALADAIIDRLGRFDRIVMRPTRAVHAAVGTDRDPVAIARSLGVDAIVDSRFIGGGDDVRLSVRLVGARDGACLWSGEFVEPATQPGALSDVVAGSIAQYLGVSRAAAGANVGGRGRDHETSPRFTGPELYELVGRGRAHLLSASIFEIPNAVAAFRKAIELDPTYAAALAGLALACCSQAALRAAPPAESYAEAKAAALRALAMDDSCADAQVALGAVLFFSEWDWSGAKRSLERAIELNPNHTEGYLLYGQVLEAVGSVERGLEAKWKALERDPFSPLVHLEIALSYFYQRRYDDTIEWANKTLELDPRHLLAREILAGAYWKKGDFDRHMAENIKHAESFGVPPQVLEPVKQAYATGGRAGVTRYALQHATSQPRPAPPLQMAILHADVGELDEALRHLDLAIDSRDPCLVQMAVGPQFDSFRGDPRFRECLARMRLSDGVGSC